MQNNKVGKLWYPLFLRFDIQLFILKPLIKADTVNDVNRAVFGLRCIWKCLQCHFVWSLPYPLALCGLFLLRCTCWNLEYNPLTLSLLMSYIYGAPCKARNFNVVYIWTYVWHRRKPSLSICYKMFQHWINAESYPVAQWCVNSLLASKVTLITDGI
jgi:hypothetical protein